MHSFSDLVSNVVSLTLNDINQRHQDISEELQSKATTSLVLNLKTLQMQRAILVTGMFSMFEAELQREHSSQNGFKECIKLLEEGGKLELKEELQMFISAINVLKHGKGRSYDMLVKKSRELPFTIIMPDQSFFFEGDVGEIQTLIEVDDDFINDCVKLILKVTSVIFIKLK